MVAWERVTGAGIGWVVAFIVGVLAILLWGLGQLPREQALLIIAVCAVRL